MAGCRAARSTTVGECVPCPRGRLLFTEAAQGERQVCTSGGEAAYPVDSLWRGGCGGRGRTRRAVGGGRLGGWWEGGGGGGEEEVAGEELMRLCSSCRLI